MRECEERYLSTVRLQVEIELRRVHDVPVDDRAGGAVPAPVRVGGVLREKPHVVALADHDDRDLCLYVRLHACSAQLRQLCGTSGMVSQKHERKGFSDRRTILQHMLELPLGDAVAEEDNTAGAARLLLIQIAVACVHLDDAEGHLLQVVDHLLPGGLHAAVGDILGSVGVDVADERRERRATIRAWSGVDDIRTVLKSAPCLVGQAQRTHPMTIVGLWGSVRTGTERASGTVLMPPSLTLIL